MKKYQKIDFSNNDIYRILFEENQNIILLIDKTTGDIIHANKSACLYYKYEYKEITSLNITDISILRKEEIAHEIEKASLEKRHFFNLTHRLSNNEFKRVKVYNTKIMVNDIEFIFSIIFDNENKKDQQLITLFNESPNAMVILDNDKKVLTVNKSFTKLFGYELKDFKEKRLNELIAPDNNDIINLDNVVKGEVININSIRISKQMFPIKVNIIANPYVFNNETIGVLIIYNDITEQSQIETELELIKENETNQIEDAKAKLQLILDSTAEAIFGIDVKGNCTFCNASGLSMLGYSSQEDLIGKKIHNLIHHSYKNGRKKTFNECKICLSLKDKKIIKIEDDVFWRADGTCFDVSYCSHPQIVNGNIKGAVITFTDITEQKKYEEYIKYISFHDTLTDLYNRQYFENEMKSIDKPENLPISIIYGDINGLKLTNDIFGHRAGDQILKKSADILKKVNDKDSIISRLGGDEFIILLPKTNKDEVKILSEKIKNEFQNEKFEAIRGSISIGYETKINSKDILKDVMETAEAWMYRDKVSNRKKNNYNMIIEIIETLHNKCFKEKMHSENVSELAKIIAEEIGMSETEIRKIKDAAYFHDIGKIVLDEKILNKGDFLLEEEKEKKRQHAIIGYRILNLFDITIDLAESVLNHHEYWNGSGYPKGLKNEEIPLASRIIAVAESYDSLTNVYNKYKLSKQEAINKIESESGKKYDPFIVDVFKKVI